METRKLIGFGRSSFVISIPKGWVERYKLQKGDDIFLMQVGDSLTISPNNLVALSKPREVTITVDGKDNERIATEITWAYLANFEVITVRSESKFDAKQLVRIKDVLQDMAGLEIMEETQNKIVARDLINVTQISIEKTIRRIDIIVRGMVEDSIASFQEDHYDSIFDRDADVNRLVFLAYRIMRGAVINPSLARELELSFLDILTYWQILMRLEKIGDQAKRIARYVREADMPPHLRKEIIEIYRTVYKDYIEVMKIFYTKRREDAFRMANVYRDEVQQLNSLSKERPDPATVNIIENLKSMTSSVKHIARSVIGGG